MRKLRIQRWAGRIAGQMDQVGSKGTKVVKYKGDRALERGLDREKARGWSVLSTHTRKAIWSKGVGLLTHKNIHTVTFTRG